MKKYILLVAALLSLASCSDYLDVKPSSQIDKDALFSTEEGFMEALNGVYSLCVSNDLYGDELTFGVPDVLAQNYSIIDLTGSRYQYDGAASYDYTDRYFIEQKDKAWAGLYRAIGNCNSLLINLELQDGILSKQTYQLIKGEALGMRAYLHLDVFRLFAPSYASNPGAPAIPYVTRFTNKVAPQLTVAAALDSVIADLNAARVLLHDADPIRNTSYTVGYPYDGDDGDSDPDDGSNEEKGPLFLQNRRHRLNYFAVCGTLARAYLCRGNKADALASAREVIDSDKFPAVEIEAASEADEAMRDRIYYTELVFGWFLANKTDVLRDRFEKSSNSLMIRRDPGNSIYESSGAGAEDIRLKYWFRTASIGSTNTLQLRKYRREDSNYHPLMAPALRLSELYYIAAEASYATDPGQAWNYFNAARLHRGIAGPQYEIKSGSEQLLQRELLKEARKEFYGEGQIFYMYKRLNANLQGIDGSVISAEDRIFKIPIPDSEREFGDRE